MLRPNLRQIEAFKAVVECGGVSRAAELLHVSQPAVSKLVSHFEHAVGFPLFHRIKGRLAITAEGQLLFDEIDRIFAGIEQITRTAEAIRSSKSGQLRIGVMPALSTGFIQFVTLPFLAARPKIQLEVHARSSQILASWLTSHQIDIAFPNAAIEHVDIGCEVLASNRLVCVLPARHTLARRETLRPRDLDGMPIVSFAESSLIAARVARVFDGSAIPLMKRVNASSAASVCAYVAGGLGFAVVDPLHIPPASPGLAVRQFEPIITNDLIMAVTRGQRSNTLAQTFAADVRRLVRAKITGTQGFLVEP